MTHEDDFERELRLLFETPAPPETDRGAKGRLPRKVQRQDAVRRALQATAYAACAGALAWCVIPALTGAVGWTTASALWLAAVGGAALWGGMARD